MATVGAPGNGFTVTLVAAEVAEQLLAFVTVTEYEPEALTVIAWVVALLLHNHEVPADAVNVTEPPVQNVVGPPGVIVAAGNAFTTTSILALGPSQL